MLRGDPASTSVADQTTVATRRDSSSGKPARASSAMSGPMLSRRKFGPHFAGSLAGSVLAVSGVYHGLSFLKNWVLRRSPFPVDPDNIRIHPDPPSWLIDARARILEQMPEFDQRESRPSVLSIDPEELARRLRMKMPWLESVVSVRLHHPGAIDLQLAFRRPIMALTLKNQGTLLLDRNGVVLPEADVRKDFLESLIKFNYPDTIVQQVTARGGKSPFEIAVGQIWEDARIADCLKLSNFLTTKQLAGKIAKPLFWFIDAANFQDRLIVRTVDGLWISWGRPPGAERPGEPDAETKWRLLMNWLENDRPASSIDLKQSILIFEKDRAVLSRGG